MTSWSLWQDAASWRVMLLGYFTFLHFFLSFLYFLALTNFFFDFFSPSLSVILCVLLFVDSVLFGSLVN